MIYLVATLTFIIGAGLGFYLGFSLALKAKMRISEDTLNFFAHALQALQQVQQVQVAWESDFDEDLN